MNTLVLRLVSALALVSATAAADPGASEPKEAFSSSATAITMPEDTVTGSGTTATKTRDERAETVAAAERVVADPRATVRADASGAMATGGGSSWSGGASVPRVAATHSSHHASTQGRASHSRHRK